MSTLSRREFLATSATLAGALAANQVLAEEATKKLVLIAGSPSHGPMEHEFNAGTLLLKKCLESVKGLELRVALSGWPKDEKIFDGADGVLIYADGGGGHPAVRGKNLAFVGELMKKGVGLMCAHFGVEVPKDLAGKEFKEWIGGYYEHLYSVNPMWSPNFTEFPSHPVTRGVKPFQVRDEWYFNVRFRDDMKGVTPLLTAKPSDEVRGGPYVYPKGPYPHIQKEKGRAEHMMWCIEREDGGRGVGFTGGHYHKNWENDGFRTVVLNALLWICKMEVPEGGVPSSVTAEELKANLDPKGKK
jgi:hypothetical protein